ncbi:hypothetical protein COP2_023558 [Malus domestica]
MQVSIAPLMAPASVAVAPKKYRLPVPLSACKIPARSLITYPISSRTDALHYAASVLTFRIPKLGFFLHSYVPSQVAPLSRLSCKWSSPAAF